MTQLEKLNNKLNKQRAKYQSAIAEVVMEAERLTGSDNLVSSDFPNDGFCIGTDDDPTECHASIRVLIEILKDKGSLSVDDILNNNFL